MARSCGVLRADVGVCWRGAALWCRARLASRMAEGNAHKVSARCSRVSTLLPGKLLRRGFSTASRRLGFGALHGHAARSAPSAAARRALHRFRVDRLAPPAAVHRFVWRLCAPLLLPRCAAELVRRLHQRVPRVCGHRAENRGASMKVACHFCAQRQETSRGGREGRRCAAEPPAAEECNTAARRGWRR